LSLGTEEQKVGSRKMLKARIVKEIMEAEEQAKAKVKAND
jgi:hypothetical protein